MRHSVSIRDEIAEKVEAMAEEEGLSISEFYARAAESHLKRIRRRRAIDELDRRAGRSTSRATLTRRSVPFTGATWTALMM